MNVLQPSIDAEVAYRRERVAAEFPPRPARELSTACARQP